MTISRQDSFNRDSNPTTIHNALYNTERTDLEVARRRALFEKALAGDQDAQAMLRTVYHLTVCIIDWRDLLNDHCATRPRQHPTPAKEHNNPPCLQN